VPDGPLLEHVAQPSAVRDRDGVGRPAYPVDGLDLAVVEPGLARLADPGDGDGLRPVGPGRDQRLGGGHVAVGAPAHEPEVVVQEGDELVEVAVGSGEADVDDEHGVGR
jgi:hypothetical protein